MKTPGPDHPMSMAINPTRVRARYEGEVIADTAGAVTLREADYPPVQYFPREDVETGYMSKTAEAYHCPYKGDATFYSLLRNGVLLEKAAWSYETPYPAAQQIAGMIAFYPQKIEIYEVGEEDLHDRRHPGAAEQWPKPE